ncbi:MAG: protein-glutamate O-methyltransferase CheR [Actinomycetota bacterium]|jgi:chemotaxis protein methyltransferase CheR|nr:protein-glutamate O-methyltransferase CheR [Actinomycetota bacterium]
MSAALRAELDAKTSPAEAAAAFAYLRDLVRERSAMAIEDGKEYLVEARLADLARQRSRSSVWDLLLWLRSQPLGQDHTAVVEAMTTNETSFFRDPGVFDGIRDVALPDLVSRRASERRLSVWSAACSTGQEPYSLAMLFAEHAAMVGSWDVRIIATDLTSWVIDRARAGRFTKLEVNRGLPAKCLLRWFAQVGTEWEVVPELRKSIEFRQLNLVGPWPHLPAMDLVLLRNVLIYFPVATKKQVLAQVRTVLRPDGYLILGNAETTLNLDHHFERVELKGSTAFRLISG